MTEDGVALLQAHVTRFNAGVRSGDFSAMVTGFVPDARMSFEGAAAGPFEGRQAIAAAYRDTPPDDEIVILDAAEGADGLVVARYAWSSRPDVAAGRLRLRADGNHIAELVVTFDADSQG